MPDAMVKPSLTMKRRLDAPPSRVYAAWTRPEMLEHWFGPTGVTAVNATVEGQTTAHYIIDRLKGLGIATSRLAHGVPVGGELDYLDEGTLSAAMRQRTLF